MEYKLTNKVSRPDNFAVSEDASFNEAVPIDLQKIASHRIIQRDNKQRY